MTSPESDTPRLMPDTKPEDQACQARPEDLRDSALKHYEELSRAACSWLSTIPHAIKFMFDDKPILERDLAAALAAKQSSYQSGFNDGAAIREQELLEERAAKEAEEARYEEMRVASRLIHESYLRIRGMLNAWNTPHAPTCEQVYSVTEAALQDLTTRADSAERELAALRADARRWRFMRETTTLRKDGGSWWINWDAWMPVNPPSVSPHSKNEELDAAVDDAMKRMYGDAALRAEPGAQGNAA